MLNVTLYTSLPIYIMSLLGRRSLHLSKYLSKKAHFQAEIQPGHPEKCLDNLGGEMSVNWKKMHRDCEKIN